MAYEFLLAVLLICVLVLINYPTFLPLAVVSFTGCLAATTLVHYALENNGKLV